MLKKAITYVNFEGEEVTEDFYFNLTKAEVLEFETTVEGGLSKRLDTISKSKDNRQIVGIFKELILKSFGEKRIDSTGKIRFVKNREISEAFAATEAYSVLYMEMLENPQVAVDFVNGIIPQIN